MLSVTASPASACASLSDSVLLPLLVSWIVSVGESMSVPDSLVSPPTTIPPAP